MASCAGPPSLETFGVHQLPVFPQRDLHHFLSFSQKGTNWELLALLK